MAGTGMPGWFKIMLAVIVAVALAFVVAAITGIGGEHGPGRHSGAKVVHMHVSPIASR